MMWESGQDRTVQLEEKLRCAMMLQDMQCCEKFIHSFITRFPIRRSRNAA